MRSFETGKLILAVTWVWLVPAAHANEDAWRTYANARFGVACEYPAVFRNRDPAPDNGDGQAFRTTGGDATLRVFGSSTSIMQRAPRC